MGLPWLAMVQSCTYLVELQQFYSVNLCTGPLSIGVDGLTWAPEAKGTADKEKSTEW